MNDMSLERKYAKFNSCKGGEIISADVYSRPAINGGKRKMNAAESV